jgi:hypothetical protein
MLIVWSPRNSEFVTMDDSTSENSPLGETSGEPQESQSDGDPVDETLPPGETDPNVLYIAVGKAIHAWENMEYALARTFAAFNNLSEDPKELVAYGSEYGMFNQRIKALERAAEVYFICHSDQNLEGDFASLLEDATNLAIRRHRIAHGHVAM